MIQEALITDTSPMTERGTEFHTIHHVKKPIQTIEGIRSIESRTSKMTDKSSVHAPMRVNIEKRTNAKHLNIWCLQVLLLGKNCPEAKGEIGDHGSRESQPVEGQV